MLYPYINEIITVSVIAIVMVISPGQDFAIITKNSLIYSRRSGVIGAIGISLAIWLHVIYCILGIAVIISQTPALYNSIKYLGAFYLAYLGLKAIFQKSDAAENDIDQHNKKKNISDIESFKNGFISNALNPKTTLIFLSLFTQIIDPSTPLSIQILYGAIISFAHIFWFVIVAYFFSSPIVANSILKYKNTVERIMGVFLCGLAAKVLTLK